MKNNKLLLFVATVMVALPLCGQNGYLDRFPDLKGDSIISRISDDGHYKITCYHSNCNIACFLVTDGNVTYNYPTSVCVESNPLNPMPALNQGYIVRDIKIKGDTCWVCGSFWRETGNWIYTQQGLEYWEVEYTGYVGYFMLSNMTSGFCFMRYVKIPFIESINKMVVIGKSVETIGSYGSNEGLYVGLTRNNDNQWEYILGKSSYQEEQFKGITYTGGKVVVLSRFNNIQHVMFYKHGM